VRKLVLVVACLAATVSMAVAPAPAQTPQERVVIAGGADAVGLNGIDVIVLSPDRFLMDHIGDTLLRWEAPGKLRPRSPPAGGTSTR
jgi:hypothetical protein